MDKNDEKASGTRDAEIYRSGKKAKKNEDSLNVDYDIGFIKIYLQTIPF